MYGVPSDNQCDNSEGESNEEQDENTCTCPVLSCEPTEIKAIRNEECCPFCEANWVEAINPEEKVVAGTVAEFTCQVNTGGVGGDDIVWTKKGSTVAVELKEGSDGRVLKVPTDSAESSGTFTCTATKEGSEASAEFIPR